jgi:hypothetical protein
LNFAGFVFIAYVGKKKRWPIGGIFELPTRFITENSLSRNVQIVTTGTGTQARKINWGA